MGAHTRDAECCQDASVSVLRQTQLIESALTCWIFTALEQASRTFIGALCHLVQPAPQVRCLGSIYKVGDLGT